MNTNRDLNEGAQRPAPRPAAPEAAPQARLADGDALDASLTSPAVHAWLDGEISDASLSIAERPQVIAMWKALSADAEKLRHMTTPSSVEAIVMQKIRSNGRG
ncbi:MAG: hypothetical protein HY275_08495 [Gemmatimonadetes bacterium]|nr:hypothetical protein [Gemmatimonadota bacterium]